MSDAEILDWLQSNCTEMREGWYGHFYIKWLDDDARPRTTKGSSIRDCVERANDYQFIPGWNL